MDAAGFILHRPFIRQKANRMIMDASKRRRPIANGFRRLIHSPCPKNIAHQEHYIPMNAIGCLMLLDHKRQ